MLNSKASDRGFPGLNFDITPFVYKLFRRTPPVTGPTDLSGFGEISLFLVASLTLQFLLDFDSFWQLHCTFNWYTVWVMISLPSLGTADQLPCQARSQSQPIYRFLVKYIYQLQNRKGCRLTPSWSHRGGDIVDCTIVVVSLNVDEQPYQAIWSLDYGFGCSGGPKF